MSECPEPKPMATKARPGKTSSRLPESRAALSAQGILGAHDRDADGLVGEDDFKPTIPDRRRRSPWKDISRHARRDNGAFCPPTFLPAPLKFMIT